MHCQRLEKFWKSVWFLLRINVARPSNWKRVLVFWGKQLWGSGQSREKLVVSRNRFRLGFTKVIYAAVISSIFYGELLLRNLRLPVGQKIDEVVVAYILS